MSDDFKDKIALVSGASRGLGFAVAERLGAAGAHVIALARTVGGLEELDDRIKAQGGQATLVPLDITDDPALERLGAAVFERWGRLDLWVHTAVQAPPLAPVEHIADKELDRAMAVNLRAVQRLIRVIDPLLRMALAGRAVFFRNGDVEGRSHHATYRALQAARDDLVQDWAKGLSATSEARALIEEVAPFRSALRARFYPGENTTRLPEPEDMATDVMARIKGACDRS